MRLKVQNKNRVPVVLYNSTGASVTIPPGVTATIDKSFATNLPKGVIIVK